MYTDCSWGLSVRVLPYYEATHFSSEMSFRYLLWMMLSWLEVFCLYFAPFSISFLHSFLSSVVSLIYGKKIARDIEQEQIKRFTKPRPAFPHLRHALPMFLIIISGKFWPTQRWKRWYLVNCATPWTKMSEATSIVLASSGFIVQILIVVLVTQYVMLQACLVRHACPPSLSLIVLLSFVVVLTDPSRWIPRISNKFAVLVRCCSLLRRIVQTAARTILDWWERLLTTCSPVLLAPHPLAHEIWNCMY